MYADNGVPVENTNEDPPLLANSDGIEYCSDDRPCKLINGRCSFKLKISKVFAVDFLTSLIPQKFDESFQDHLSLCYYSGDSSCFYNTVFGNVPFLAMFSIIKCMLFQ